MFLGYLFCLDDLINNGKYITKLEFFNCKVY